MASFSIIFTHIWIIIFNKTFLWSALLVLLLYFLSMRWLENRHLPPGPRLIPFIGCIPKIIGSLDARYIYKLSRHFNSDVISMRVFGQLVVFLNSHERIREMYAKRTDLVDRIDYNLLQVADPKHQGLVMSWGPIWKETRRFTLLHMRDIGMGKSGADNYICEETDHVLRELTSRDQTKAFDPTSLINMAVSNTICSFIFGKRFNYTDVKFKQSLADLNSFVWNISRPVNIFTFRFRLGRWLRMESLKKTRTYWSSFIHFVNEQIEEHKRNFDGSVCDLIDGFIKEMEQKQSPDTFNDHQLQCLIVDMFAAGSETTFTTLRWLLLYMAVHQDVQERVRKELCSRLEPTECPRMSDRRHTPYTEAVIYEVQRVNTVFELGLFHTCRDDHFTVGEYNIPRATPVSANLLSVHRDPAVWMDPDHFNPDNFLQDGKRLVNTEKFISFSIGRRSCAGEPLARAELYIFFSSWIRDFHVSIPEGSTADMDPLGGIGVRQPKPFKIMMKKRK